MFAALKLGFLIKMAQKIYMKWARPVLAAKVEATPNKVDDAFLVFIDLFFDPEKAALGLAQLSLGEFYEMMCETYAQYRELLLSAIDDPNAVWDDYLMKLLDKAMSYDRVSEPDPGAEGGDR